MEKELTKIFEALSVDVAVEVEVESRIGVEVASTTGAEVDSEIKFSWLLSSIRVGSLTFETSATGADSGAGTGSEIKFSSAKVTEKKPQNIIMAERRKNNFLEQFCRGIYVNNYNKKWSFLGAKNKLFYPILWID